MTSTRRAFTLVELLVVIAIIGLLSSIAVVSLGNARIKARDAKRMADLKQISQAIEMYANNSGALPGGLAGWCTYLSNAGFVQAASDISPYLANLPHDPTKPSQIGDYFYRNTDNRNKYVLCANLEQATGQSYDYTVSCTGTIIYNYCIMPNG